MQDLESIAVFVTVAKSASFSEAARELGFSPSAVSKRIARLEAQLGVSLLSRTTRKVQLTEAGEEYFERCSGGLTTIAEADEVMARFGEMPQGMLRAKVPQAFGRLHIAPHIPAFLAKHPQISIDLRYGRLRGEQLQERIDVVIASSDPPNVNLAVKTLTRITRVTCAAPSYIARAGKPASVRDLSNHNCLIFSGSDTVENEWVLRGRGTIQRVRVAGRFRTNDAETMHSAVLGGLGIAHMPTFLVGPDLSSGRLIPIFRDANNSQSASMKVYFPRAKDSPPKIRVFVDFLVALFKGKNWPD
jgi:DNA-binding transcriptional LysR family regulator